MALFAPAATPAPVLAKLNADVDAALAEAQIRERLEQIGVLPVGGPLAASETYVYAEIKKWGDVGARSASRSINRTPRGPPLPAPRQPLLDLRSAGRGAAAVGAAAGTRNLRGHVVQ